MHADSYFVLWTRLKETRQILYHNKRPIFVCFVLYYTVCYIIIFFAFLFYAFVRFFFIFLRCGFAKFARQSNRCDDSSETKEQDVFSSHLLCVHVVSHDTVHRKYNFARPC